jgi:hypothetical protein
MTKLYVMFSGAGGTGKSSVMNLLGQHFSSSQMAVLPSQTRDMYKVLGPKHGMSDTPNEQEFFKLNQEQQLSFQVDIAQEYIRRALQFAQANSSSDIVFFERSLFDNLGYCLSTQIYDKDSSPYEAALQMIGQAFSELTDYHEQEQCPLFLCFLFPYPPPWSLENNKDGFRSVNYRKDLVWSLVTKGLHKDYEDYTNTDDNVPFTYDCLTIPEGSPIERTYYVITEIQRALDFWAERQQREVEFDGDDDDFPSFNRIVINPDKK